MCNKIFFLAASTCQRNKTSARLQSGQIASSDSDFSRQSVALLLHAVPGAVKLKMRLNFSGPICLINCLLDFELLNYGKTDGLKPWWLTTFPGIRGLPKISSKRELNSQNFLTRDPQSRRNQWVLIRVHFQNLKTS